MLPDMNTFPDWLPLNRIAIKYRKSPETIRLWVTKGILLNGERIKLPAMKIGGTWMVSESALLDWFARWSMVPEQRTANFKMEQAT